MFDNDDKRKLYWVLGEYLNDKISPHEFCDIFHLCYHRDLDIESLNEIEANAFADLSKVIDRFSQFDEDIKNYPGVYYTESELCEMAIKTNNKLLNL